jgi:RimJ/RimL family protein N-acetyltransferase
MLKGSLTYLSAIEESDLACLQKWRNNPDFRKYFREYRELNMKHQEKWFNEKVVNDNTTMMFSIRRNSDNELLGCCGLVYINWVHRHADLSLYIGWKEAYIDSEGYADDACRTLFCYAFEELGLNKIWTEIYEFDHLKKEFYDRLGLSQDGFLRQNYFYEGKWWNSRILSYLSSEYFTSKENKA